MGLNREQKDQLTKVRLIFDTVRLSTEYTTLQVCSDSTFGCPDPLFVLFERATIRHCVISSSCFVRARWLFLVL